MPPQTKRQKQQLKQMKEKHDEEARICDLYEEKQKLEAKIKAMQGKKVDSGNDEEEALEDNDGDKKPSAMVIDHEVSHLADYQWKGPTFARRLEKSHGTSAQIASVASQTIQFG